MRLLSLVGANADAPAVASLRAKLSIIRGIELNNPSKKTSVVLFTHSLSGGGVQIAFVRLAEELADTGYRVAIVCQVAAEATVAMPQAKFEVHVLGTPHVRQLIRPFLKFTKEWRPDVVISSLPHNNIMMIITKLLSFSNWKLIITEHGPLTNLIEFSNDVRFKVLPYVIPVLYPFADAVVAVSRGIADELRRFAPRISRLVVIYNPIVQLRTLAPLADVRATAIADDVPTIIGVGRLSAEKDFSLLIRAFATLRARRLAKLVILGEGPERPVLENLVRELGCQKDVSLRGWVDDLSTYYSRARVVAVSSRFEGFGNVIVEALSFGTPVVATDCPFGPREILEGGKFGRLVPMGNHQAFADALEQTIDSPQDPEVLRSRAEDFTIAASLKGYDQLIQALVPSRAGAPGRSFQDRAGRRFRLAIYMNDLSGGGVERMRLILIPTFIAAGFDVTLLLHSTRGELRQSVPAGLRIVEFGTSRTLYDLFPMARFLRRERPDLLLSSLNHNNVVAALAGLLSGLKTKVVICQHNSLSDEAKTLGWKYRIIPVLYRLLDPVIARFVAVSKGVADDMARVTGVRRDRIEPIYNPVIDDTFAKRAEQPVSHPWFENREAVVFVTAGRLVEQKDHATLIKAFAAVMKRQPAKLLVLGTGPLHEELEEQAKSLGVAEHIDFLGFKENALPYFRESDAFVLASRYEGLGNVIVEAMRCGTPVITTDCPYGPSEIVQDGDFGVLVPVGDSDALAEAMLSSKWRRWTREELMKSVEKFQTSSVTLEYQSLFNNSV